MIMVLMSGPRLAQSMNCIPAKYYFLAILITRQATQIFRSFFVVSANITFIFVLNRPDAEAVHGFKGQISE